MLEENAKGKYNTVEKSFVEMGHSVRNDLKKSVMEV